MALSGGRDRITWNITDLQGQTGTTGVYPLAAVNLAVPSAELTAFFDALRGLTIGSLNNGTLSVKVVESAAEAPSAGDYENIEDKAVILFKSANGDVTTFEVPCPDDGIFEADKETVDPLDAAVIAFVSAVLAFAADKAGNAIIAFYKGYRSRASKRAS